MATGDLLRPNAYGDRERRRFLGRYSRVEPPLRDLVRDVTQGGMSACYARQDDYRRN